MQPVNTQHQQQNPDPQDHCGLGGQNFMDWEVCLKADYLEEITYFAQSLYLIMDKTTRLGPCLFLYRRSTNRGEMGVPVNIIYLLS